MIFEWFLLFVLFYILLIVWDTWEQKTAKIPDFNGKVVLVTGASSGIGRQLAKDLNQKGAEVVITARRIEALEQVKQECKFPQKVHVVRMDLNNIEEVQEICVKEINQKYKIDILINNGGVGIRDEFKNIHLKVVRQVMNVNFLSVCALSRYIGEGMVQRKQGHIVNIGSMAGLFPLPMRTIYSASKYSVKLFSNSLKAELRDSGVIITDVFPGYVKTNVSANALVGDGKLYGKLDDNIGGGMEVDDLCRRALHYIKMNESRKGLNRFFGLDYSRLVVGKFYAKLVVILCSLSDDIYEFISKIQYKVYLIYKPTNRPKLKSQRTLNKLLCSLIRKCFSQDTM
ncbi:unnamed protein product [Moneuplotes crassus]|uniref:Uncharacterized protein n=1 Tax=Euplotes crassus TaxID=5936 RepID=A0AAD1UL54_EUPCR|nr:unnamed protein product [Moneuplotes crassus]